MRLPAKALTPLVILAFLNGCGRGEGVADAAPPVAETSGPASDYPMTIGDPFTIDGVTYKPEDRLNYDHVGYASVWLEGGNSISAAHKTLPLPSYVEVTSLESGRTILARVERRGPMTNDRLIELSPGAAMQLGLAGDVKAPVRVRRVNPPEPERAALRAGQPAPPRMDTPKTLLAVLNRKLDGPAAAASPEPAETPAAVVNPATSGPALAAKPQPPVRKPAARPTPVPTPSAAPSSAAVTPSARPTPAPKPAQAARPAAATRPAPPAAPRTTPDGTLIVQVASFSQRQNADRAAARLGGHVETVGPYFRVRLGRYSNQGDASAALAKAKAAGYSDARIQRAN